MKQYLRYFVPVLSSLLLLPGCASKSDATLYHGIQRSGAIAHPNDKGLVIIYHDPGGGAAMDVYQNGQLIASIPDNSFYTYYCNPGTATFSLKVDYHQKVGQSAGTGAMSGGMSAGVAGMFAGAAAGAVSAAITNSMAPKPGAAPLPVDVAVVNVQPGQTYYLSVQPLRWSHHLEQRTQKQGEKELGLSAWLNPPSQQPLPSHAN
jgi:hypothetical protein